MSRTATSRTTDAPGSRLRHRLAAVTGVALSLGSAAVVAAPASQAAPAPVLASSSCNDTSWTWPFCHIGRPSIPRYDVNGPRPPLTPKNSVWCTAGLVTVGDGVGWYRVTSTKHDLRFWPDYYHHELVGIVWNGWTWTQTSQPVYTSVDCDA